MTMPADMKAHNEQLIAQFRADGGASMGDRKLLLLTTVGRRSGERRTTPMMYVPDGERYLVIASNAGAPADPDWVRNLVADPAVRVELPGDAFDGRAVPLTGSDYERTWARIKNEYSFFVEHEEKAGRTIPVVALTRS